MTAKLTEAPTIATDTLADLVVAKIFEREAELEALIEAGHPVQDELAVVRELLRSIPNARIPFSRLH